MEFILMIFLRQEKLNLYEVLDLNSALRIKNCYFQYFVNFVYLE